MGRLSILVGYAQRIINELNSTFPGKHAKVENKLIKFTPYVQSKAEIDFYLFFLFPLIIDTPDFYHTQQSTLPGFLPHMYVYVCMYIQHISYAV